MTIRWIFKDPKPSSSKLPAMPPGPSNTGSGNGNGGNNGSGTGGGGAGVGGADKHESSDDFRDSSLRSVRSGLWVD